MTASQPSSNKTKHISEKLVLNLCATFVVSNFQVKPFSMTTIVMSTHKLNPLAICVTSLSGAKIKLRYHITSSHAEKEAFQCDIKSVGIQCTILRKTCLCGYTTAKEFKLDKHGESCGKTLDPNSIDHCKLCHKTFLTKKSLR